MNTFIFFKVLETKQKKKNKERIFRIVSVHEWVGQTEEGGGPESGRTAVGRVKEHQTARTKVFD